MQYQFVGEGIGVPGLPHVITDQEAEELGVGEILRAAVENGNYVAVDNGPSTMDDEQSSVGSKQKAEEE